MPSASPSVRLSVGLSVSISPELHTSDPHQLCTRYLGPWFGRQAVLGTLLVLEGRVLDTSLWLGRPLAACISGSTIQMTSCLHVTGPMDARRRSKRRHCVVVRRLTPLSRNILVAGSETSECIVQGLAGTQHAVGVFVTRLTVQLAVHSNCLQFQSAITRTLHRE